jgi:hypothetical protein
MPKKGRGRGGRRPGAGRPPLPEDQKVIGESVYLTSAEWAWLELWMPGGNRSEQVRELLERARKFWPSGPARFR